MQKIIIFDDERMKDKTMKLKRIIHVGERIKG